MKIINGVYTSATVFSDTIEDYAAAQIKMLCDNEVFQNCKVKVMPDVHPGKVGTIGFTSTVGDKVLPNVVGIDIGCGITLARPKQRKAEFQRFDKVIRENIPSGFSIRQNPHRFREEFDFSSLFCSRAINNRKAALSIGTLGGGNHFIELDKDTEGSLYVQSTVGADILEKK